MSGFVDQFLHVGRQVAGEAQPVRSDRVNEAKYRRVKRLALESQLLQDRSNRRTGTPIERIAY